MERMIFEDYAQAEKYDSTYDGIPIPHENSHKLRIYVTKGIHKGDLDHEEFFSSKEQLDARYNELFVYENYGYNPTAWELVDNEWRRIEGY